MRTDLDAHLPARQRAIRAKCFHPTGTFVPFPIEALDASLPQRFDEQVARNPGRLALKTRHHALTYGELNVVANRIAHVIMGHPDPSQAPVALLFTHDAVAIAAMLGVLKAGRGYMPLDPSYPRQRIEFVLSDSTARLLLTEHRLVDRARELAGDTVHVVEVDALDAPAANPSVTSGPDSPAFVLYTSGSTGRPKGVLQNHRNVLHDAMHYTNSGHFCADDRFLLVSSVSFADSVRTIYSALLNGAGLYPFDIHSEGLSPLAEWLVEQQITVYRSVPTVFRHFASSLTGKDTFHDLRLVYLGGEAVQRIDVELYKRHFSSTCILVNRLGTSETLTFRSNFIDHDTDIATLVPVGYGVPDKEVLIVNESGEPVENGATGELAVRSRYLTPGYWRNPELTRAAFAADPADPDRRLYRTGDLARMLADGCLEYLGRKDFQIKIRGHRVETAEVEAALLSLNTIREAVVAAERRSSHDRLVAYIVPTTHPAPEGSAIRRHLVARLPDYMVPSAYVVLDALPLLPNGKLDRQALPAPGSERPELDEPFVAPRNVVEEEIARTWAEVLALDRVGVFDDFLELGGDSLMATRVIARVCDRFDVALSVPVLWKASTVALMAELIGERLLRDR